MISEVTDWAQLPLILTSDHMERLYGVSGKTISRWSRNGHIPQPVLSSGNIRRWDREIVKQHLERRQKMR